MTTSVKSACWNVDKKTLSKHASVIYGAWRTASPQRQHKREQRRQQLKQQRQAKPQARGFGS